MIAEESTAWEGVTTLRPVSTSFLGRFARVSWRLLSWRFERFRLNLRMHPSLGAFGLSLTPCWLKRLFAHRSLANANPCNMQGNFHGTGAIAVFVVLACLCLLGIDVGSDESAQRGEEKQEATCSLHSETMNGTYCGNNGNKTLWDASDLWKIDGLYYDLRPLFSWHPGSTLPLEKTKGTDASILFQVQHISEGPRLGLRKYQAGLRGNN